jgi:UDP-N-acetylmuramoyl-L-alanyl-D-glutamate--2,6-diaminopimelate ligase
METYFKAKSRLFRQLEEYQGKERPAAVINTDDPKGVELVRATQAPVVTYGLGANCQVRANSVRAESRGLKAKLVTPAGERDIQSALIGEINIYNIMAATAAALSLDIDLDSIVEGIKALKVVPGRLESVPNMRGLDLIVDYAHTPDALLKTLTTLRPLTEGNLITVFGCGGDRDRGKRFEMGLVAGEHSDLVVITSDNPRTEEPLSIIEQIEKGVRKSGMNRLNLSGPSDRIATPGYFVEADRRKAIRRAILMAAEKDLVLIAGKGHEDYQIIGQRRRDFDDRKEALLAASEALQ